MDKTEHQTTWKLVYEGFDPAQEGLRESLCTLGNGYFGTRGTSVEAFASRIHYPATYIAGVYNRLPTHIAGRTIYNEDLVNCPNWLFITFKIGDSGWFWPSTGRIISWRQELDMRRGVLNRSIRFHNHIGQRTLITSSQIVHMDDPHYGAVKYVITPENYSDRITLRTLLDGMIINAGVERYRQLNAKHLKPASLGSFAKNGVYLSMMTNQSRVEISLASRVRFFAAGREVKPAIVHLDKGRERIGQQFRFFAKQGESYQVEKTVAIYTSRDKDTEKPVEAAVAAANRAPRFDNLLETHQRAWEALWDKFDVQIEGDAFSQRVLRLHAFHLLQTASRHNSRLDAGFPARGLHGEAYRGHVFWDELYAMPFYDLHMPQVSQALLMYRYRRLPKAREYAHQQGYKGAMFPWQSASSGAEETQTMHLNPMSGEWGPDYSCLQRHVSFAIAYNVWMHWERVGDMSFLMRYGAEIILSIAQFCASLVKFDAQDGRYHTKGIMGPDEFHEKFPGFHKPGLKDNAYSNVMIVWVLRKAIELLTILPEKCVSHLITKLKLEQKDFSFWADITKKMNIIVNKDGIISQFLGYFNLKELDWEGYRREYGNIHRMDRILKAEGESPDEYKVAKQADVLMLFYLFPLSEMKEIFSSLGYFFDKNTLRKNYEYYEKRTSHGSTLSKVVHCMVAHSLTKPKEFWRWFNEVLQSDIHDTQGGTTLEGIHCGVMGGSLEIVRRSIAGIGLMEGGIKINPDLPEAWDNLKCKFRYRNKWVSLSITKSHVSILIDDPQSRASRVPVEICGKFYYLPAGKPFRVPIG